MRAAPPVRDTTGYERDLSRAQSAARYGVADGRLEPRVDAAPGTVLRRLVVEGVLGHRRGRLAWQAPQARMTP